MRLWELWSSKYELDIENGELLKMKIESRLIIIIFRRSKKLRNVRENSIDVA